MAKVTINGTDYEFENGLSLIQACDSVGIEVPRFCYHERLSVAGNCRMCLVEVEKSPKPVASCAMPIAEGMVVHTNTPSVKKAREGVMEFLLINHPLDCPICDQGGECDLQDQAVAYGSGLSRYTEQKRAVSEKEMGPLIKTFMTRCIHCTRCVRFASEIAGVEDLGATSRGEDMEITTYVGKAIASELSGNLVDVCPVGALTSKPYAFHARPWELSKTDSIDVFDAVGSNIRVDSRGAVVMRALPRLNEDVNEEWISDKTRHAVDGLKVQRLDRPMIREQGKLRVASWEEALTLVAKKLTGTDAKHIGAIAGDLVDAESMMALKDVFTALGSVNLDCRQDGAALMPAKRASYRFNTTITGIEAADVCVLIGTNPRHEAALINARLRKRFLRGNFQVFNIGPSSDLTYPVTELGNNPALLAEILAGKHPLAKILKSTKAPMLVLGMGALTHADGEAVMVTAQAIAEKFGLIRDDWNGFNVLHTAAARVGGLDLGFVPGRGGKDVKKMLRGAQSGDVEVLYLLGADELDMSQLGNAFVIYQGHHGDAGAHRADVVLPGAAYTEKDGTYVNTEGRVQFGFGAILPPGEAKEDWRILRALSDYLGHTLPYDTLPELRARMVEAAPHFAHEGEAVPMAWEPLGIEINIKPTDRPFTLPVGNFYMTDPISRASRTMAECSAVFSNPVKKAA